MGNKARIGVLVFFLSLSSCTAQEFASEFYEGLKKRQNDDQSGAATCFENALDSANTAVAAVAAAELMSLHLAGTELSATAMDIIRQKAEGPWARAFFAIDSPEKIIPLLLSGETRSLNDSSFEGEAARYVLEKWRSGEVENVATEAENAAVDGRFAVSRSRYNEALLFFNIALRDSPDLFLRYPDLISDLGRAFQYTATGREGIDLLLKWEGNLPGFVSGDGENLIRFRLLFFAARIARQRGDPSHIDLFEKALPFAHEVSSEQADACIWYILDSSIAQWPAHGTNRTIQYLEKYVSQWHDDDYFSDVMDKLARELILKKQWEDLANVSALLQNRFGSVAAQYAWISGRAIQDGLFSPGRYVSAYARIAYNAAGGSPGSGAVIGNSAWYYRSLSATALGEPFLLLPKAAAKQETPAAITDTMQFLLGFFENNAAQFAPRYIRAQEKNLFPEELYRLAEALGAAGQYQESIRLVSLYTRKDGYQIAKKDLELLYPRPFKEPVEQCAQETGIEPAMLYGLIRTESAFNSDAVSSAGALGLTQLLPATAQETAVRIKRQGGPDYTGDDINLFDPAANIHIGAAYLAFLKVRMEDPMLALLSYNGGMNRVRRWRRASNLPTDLFLETVEFRETRNYGRSVMGAAAMYNELYYNR
ncbi:MAG: lytic transglycosylase domain-containing protein [Treponema sp.]|jgi:soluble lytic murein transglycosylase|nr:lytic transglycosylase domain-containing protein [Treponema sp.]